MPTLKLPGQVDPLALHRRSPARYPFLLQSTAFEPSRGRYDVLAAFPQSGLRLDSDGVVRDLSGQSHAGTFPELLDTAWRAARAGQQRDATLPFVGGWALFFSYEFAGVVEPVLDLPAPAEPLPLALALRCPAAVIVDRVENATWLVVEPGYEALLQALRTDIDACTGDAPSEPRPPVVLGIEVVHQAPQPRVFVVRIQRAEAAQLLQDVFARTAMFGQGMGQGCASCNEASRSATTRAARCGAGSYRSAM